MSLVRRDHLRETGQDDGREACEVMQGVQDAITFGQEDIRIVLCGASHACAGDGQPLERQWLRRAAPVVLWFQSANDSNDNGDDKAIGLEYYIQACAAQPDEGKGVAEASALELDAASDRHVECAKEFEQEMTKWSAIQLLRRATWK